MTPVGQRCMGSGRSNSPPGQAQTLTVLSPLPEARVLPSGLQVTAETGLLWPVRVRSNSPPGQAQTLTVLSSLPEARVLPSGLQVTARDRGSPAMAQLYKRVLQRGWQTPRRRVRTRRARHPLCWLCAAHAPSYPGLMTMVRVRCAWASSCVFGCGTGGGSADACSRLDRFHFVPVLRREDTLNGTDYQIG